MSREQAFLNMLDAAANVQWNVSMILEAKAVEAEKVRNWILNHVLTDSFPDHEKQLSDPLDVHDQIVELIEGLTKLQNGLCSNLKTVLGPDGDDSAGGPGYGGMFGGGLDLEDADK